MDTINNGCLVLDSPDNTNNESFDTSSFTNNSTATSKFYNEGHFRTVQIAISDDEYACMQQQQTPIVFRIICRKSAKR